MHIKQLLALLLAAVLLSGLCACGLKPAEPEKTAEAPELEKGWYAVLDDDDPVGYLYSTGKRVTFLNADGEAELEDIRLKWDAEALAFVIDNSPAFSLEVSKRTVTMTVPKKSPLPYDKGSYTLEEIDEDELPDAENDRQETRPADTDPAEEPDTDTPAALPEAGPAVSDPSAEPDSGTDAVPDDNKPNEDAAASAEEEAYAAAVALMESGDYDSAFRAFDALGDYRDSVTLRDDCAWYSVFMNTRVGDSVWLGLCEQDNNTYNGSEQIEWIVLDIQDNRMLVVSRYALDAINYNPSTADTTWETCYLRGWLNDAFFFGVFDELEQSFIAETAITAERNPDYSTPAGNDTTDHVFLLSVSEANRYFRDNEARKCLPTTYARSKGVSIDSGKHTLHGETTCEWWLRTQGDSADDAAGVYPSGTIYTGGFHANNAKIGVRPAMWVIIAP